MEATHFIEIWYEEDGEIGYDKKPRLIEKLDSYLEWTRSIGFTTIAIFKIRYKCK